MSRLVCWMFQSNQWIILCCLSVQCLLLNFVSADYRKWLPSKKLFNFYLFPVSLGQVCFVLVLTSTNHKARYRYPEMAMARTVYQDQTWTVKHIPVTFRSIPSSLRKKLSSGAQWWSSPVLSPSAATWTYASPASSSSPSSSSSKSSPSLPLRWWVPSKRKYPIVSSTRHPVPSNHMQLIYFD